MPKILYGTAWKKERTADLVEKAVLVGFRGIDTACQPKHYHEAGVGQGIGRLRAQGIQRQSLFLQTKFTPIDGQDPARVPYDPMETLGNQVLQSFAVSLKNLGTDYLDSLVLHSPLSSHVQTMAVWRAFESLVETGGVRQLGISNCYDLAVLERLYQDAKIKPSIVQNRFYRETRYDKTLRDFCTARSIVYQSFWTLSANPEILNHQTVKAIARDFKKTEAQIFFRYVIQLGAVPLTGTCSEQHMREDLGIFEFELPEASIQAIGKLLA